MKQTRVAKPSRSSKPTQASRSAGASSQSVWLLRVAGTASAIVWWLCLKAYASRWIVLLHYEARAVVSPALEAAAPMSSVAFVFSLACLAGWVGCNEMLWRRRSALQLGDSTNWGWAVAWLSVASFPWIVSLVMHWHVTEPLEPGGGPWGPAVWQPLWLACFSGLAAERFARALRSETEPSRIIQEESELALASKGKVTRWHVLVTTASVGCGGWWFLQSQQAFDRFMLGFNDCGHFAQRIANTAAGRGWLLESPVLPAFWDHFNPGLTMLVPLWLLWPDMSLFFVLQAAALAGCAPLVMLLARALGASPSAAALWALAWLAHPVLGQMNLAYTYGWHPISMAIPSLIACLVCLVQRRWLWAIVWATLASSFEEGVLVILATTAATLGAIELAGTRIAFAQVARRVSGIASARTWILAAGIVTLVFVLIYRFSGLAEFQTGRFHTLGDSATDVLTSPITNPRAFWGLLLRQRNAIFLAGLLIPCYLPILARGWPLLLPLVLPLTVLLVWDHLPAQSLAFHYPSTLLPALWLAALLGATYANAETQRNRAWQTGWAALMTCLVAGLYFGQMPWSSSTQHDVLAVTYGTQTQYRREPGSRDHRFAHEQLARIRAGGASALATGRFATHLVGAADLETVGQFFQRRDALQKLKPDEHPLRRYETLILDRLENFQQQTDQTGQLEREALANGFRVTADQYEIVVLERE